MNKSALSVAPHELAIAGRLRLWLYVAILTMVFVVAIFVLEMVSSWSRLDVVMTLVGLALVASHSEALFADHTGLNGSMVVAMAAVVACAPVGDFMTPAICAGVSSLYLPHIRSRSWAKICVNASATGLSAMASTGLVALSVGSGGAEFVGSLLAGVGAYWIFNNGLIGIAVGLVADRSPLEQVRELVRSEPEMLVFAFAGGLCGRLFVEVGVWAGAVALVGVLAAVDLLIVTRRRPRPLIRRRGRVLLARVGVGAVVVTTTAVAEPELGSELAGLVGIGLALGIPFGAALLGLRRRSGAWATSVSIGVAAAEAPVFLAATAVGLAWARFGVLVGVAAGGATLVALLVWTAWSHRRRREAVAAVDALEAWAIVELARADQDGARTG